MGLSASVSFAPLPYPLLPIFALAPFFARAKRFLRFFTSRRSSLNQIGRTRSITPPVGLLSCYIPLKMHLAGNFSKLLSQPFPQKQVNTAISNNVVGSKNKARRQDRKVMWDFFSE